MLVVGGDGRSMKTPEFTTEHAVATVCPLDCPDGCSLEATVQDGRVVSCDPSIDTTRPSCTVASRLHPSGQSSGQTVATACSVVNSGVFIDLPSPPTTNIIADAPRRHHRRRSEEHT